MRWLHVLGIAGMVVGCGSSAPAAQPVGGAGVPSIDAGLPPLALGCPPTWAAATGPCDPALLSGTCAYAEGTSNCGVESVCSGAAPDPDVVPGPASWQRSPRLPDVRDDGCPGVEPSGACWSEGKVCSYGACCFRELTCRDGGWTMTGGGCPP